MLSPEDSWNDLKDRLVRATVTLTTLEHEARDRYADSGVDSGPEVHRLRGKREGVELALSYMREYVRT